MQTALKLTVSTVALVLSAPVLAQDATASSQQPAEQASAGFGDIIVTAQKRGESLQKVPISISAYSGEQLEQLGITNSTEITEQIPGLQLNAWSPNVTIFALRGISQNNFTDNLEAPVAVYVDNAYVGSINGISGQLFDTERVEVLRGPQGTLFGRNATGGLIHYLSRDASESFTNGYAEASYGRFNDWSLEGAIGGSITEDVRFRGSARINQADGYVISRDTSPDLPGSGQDLGGKDGWAVRGTIQADVTPDLLLNLWVKYSEDNDVATGGYVFDNCDFQANGFCGVNSAGLSNGSGGVINGITAEPASPFEHFGERPGFLNRETTIVQADWTYDLDGVEITSITNWIDLSKTYGEDGDAIPVLVINFDTGVDYNQFSQEFRISGESDRFRWQAGAYYLDIDIDGDIITQGAPVLGAAIDANGTAIDPSVEQTYLLESKNWSVFGQTDIDLTDELVLTLGGRYSQDTKTIDYLAILRDADVAPDITISSTESFEQTVPGVSRIRFGDWAGRAALNYNLNPDTIVFASWNRGIKGGNWSLGSDVVAENFRHDEEILNSFELGFKTAFANQTLRLNGTVFHYLYDDYQAFSVVGGVPQVNNTDATSTGAEVELFWSPSARFDAILGGTWQVSNVDEVNGAGEQFGPEFFPGAPDAQFCSNQGGFFFCDFPDDVITDAELPNAPRFSLNYLLRYNVDVGNGNFAAQLDGAWFDEQFLEVTNGLSSLQPAYNVSNFSISHEGYGSGVTLTAFVRNVFDQEYRAYTLNLGILGTTSFFAPPRTYGASARISF